MKEYTFTQIWMSLEDLYGKEFVYKSKYGGKVNGIIKKIFFQLDEGKISIYRVESTNNVSYKASEITIK